MAKTNKTRYALLGVLAFRPASGYDIKKFCDKSIAHFWHENYGHIYPVLKELEADGLIAGEKLETGGKPPRTVYSITDQGRGELGAWLMSPVKPEPVRHELLLKLIFADNVPLGSTVEMLKASRRLYAAHLDKYRKIAVQYESDPSLMKNKGYPYWMATLRYGMMDAEFRVRWCDETLERLQKRTGNG
jgi:DNA-binding PadR family transcriptional regulator